MRALLLALAGTATLAGSAAIAPWAGWAWLGGGAVVATTLALMGLFEAAALLLDRAERAREPLPPLAAIPVSLAVCGVVGGAVTLLVWVTA